MMRLMLILILLLAFPVAAQAQGRVLTIDVDTIEDVTLGDEGRRVVRFRTEHTGRLRADLFSHADSTGVISFTFQEAGGSDDEKDALPAVVGPGRYEAIIQAVNPGAATIQVRIWLDIPLDEFETNDSRETARRIDIPFDGVISLSGTDRDWFRVDTASGGVLGIQLYTGGASTTARIAVYDHAGTEVFLSDDNPWGTTGMRYVRSTGRAMYILVWDQTEWGDTDAANYKTLNVRQYRPEGTPASDNALVTLSVEGDSTASFQLDLIGDAIGVNTVAANEADAVARELRTAIEGQNNSIWRSVLALLVLIVLGVGGFFGRRYWQQRSGKAPESSPTPPPTSESDT